MPPRIGPKRPVRVFLAEHRADQGLSQEQLGNRISPPVDKGTVSKWENAKPGGLTLGVIAAYAEALGKHVTEMYRPPAEGPSLDAMAASLDAGLREHVAETIALLKRRRA